MSVEIDRIEIMRRADNAIKLWREQILGLEGLMKDRTGLTCLRVAADRLGGFHTWINAAMNCEKESKREVSHE